MTAESVRAAGASALARASRALLPAAICVLALAAWLLIPTPAATIDLAPPLRVVVVDASASVRRARSDWLAWSRRALARQADEAAAQGERIAVVSFASEVGVGFAQSSPEAFRAHLVGRGGAPFDPAATAGGDQASRLADALDVAAELCLAPGRAPGTVHLLGSETYTGRDPSPALARLVAAGARFEHELAPAPDRSDLALVALELPETIEAGAPLRARAKLRWSAASVDALADSPADSSAAARGFLDVELRNAGVRRPSSLTLELPAAGGEFEVSIPCGSAGFGRTELVCEVRLESGADPFPENDFARAATRAAGELVVLVAAESSRLDEARDWLAPSGASALAGIQFLFAPLEELARSLDEVDALVTFDLPLSELPAPVVESFVRRGGGWLATSGSRFLDDWIPGESNGALAELLPLEPAPLERGPRDVVLLVDGSGSMAGEPFDTVRAATLELVAAALPSDEVSLRFFTVHVQPPRVIKARSRLAEDDVGATEEAARRLLELHVPRGDTRILVSLEELARERRSSEREALVFVLTDGLEREGMPAGELERRAAALRGALSEARCELRPIAIGERADLAFLGRVVRPGDEVLVPSGLKELGEIFRREVTRAQCRDGELALVWATLDPQSIAASLRGSEPEPLAPIARLVKNERRPGAEVLWIADRGEPVLALTRIGLGRTALLSSHPGPGWAPAWSRRLGIGEPSRFGNLLRWLGRGPERRAGVPRLELEGGELRLTGLDGRWPAVVEAEILDARGRPREPERRLRLVPSAGRDPLGARSTAWEPAAFFGLVEAPLLAFEGPDGERHTLPLPAGLPSEFDGGGTPLAVARFLGPPRSARASQSKQPTTRRGAVWLLALGLGMLFLGAAQRGRSAA